MNKSCIVSCFYTNLHGTKFGGRLGIESRYIHSFRSLLKINNADFIVFCDPNQLDMLYEQAELINHPHVTLIPFNLENFYMQDLFFKYKDYNFAKTESNRCQEIQYNKSFWMKQVSEQYDYDHIFWIDIGISYSGLIPDKYLIFPENGKHEYYNSILYSNDLVDGMKSFTKDRFLLMMIHNHEPVFYRKVLYDFFDHENEKHHAIGGILGGKKETIKPFHDLFVTTSIEVAEKEQTIHDEEAIYQVMYERNREFFADKRFDTWYHENNAEGISCGDLTMLNKFLSSKPFCEAVMDFHREVGSHNAL